MLAGSLNLARFLHRVILVREMAVHEGVDGDGEGAAHDDDEDYKDEADLRDQ